MPIYVFHNESSLSFPGVKVVDIVYELYIERDWRIVRRRSCGVVHQPDGEIRGSNRFSPLINVADY